MSAKGLCELVGWPFGRRMCRDTKPQDPRLWRFRALATVRAKAPRSDESGFGAGRWQPFTTYQKKSRTDSDFRPAPEIGAPRRNHCRALTKLEYFDFKSSYAQMWKKILIDWTCYATVSERRAAGGAR